jgi:hypothetical protein
MTMLSLLKRRYGSDHSAEMANAVKRDRQQNINVSEDCAVAFQALAKVQGLSKAALFEDMVAERVETLKGQGVKLELLSG